MTTTHLDFKLPGHIRSIRVEHVPHLELWRLWLAANRDFTCGTFIALCDDGSIQRRHIHPDGTETWLEELEERY